jgi:hypothetical protein
MSAMAIRLARQFDDITQTTSASVTIEMNPRSSADREPSIKDHQ